MASKYTVYVQEDQEERKELGTNGYNLAVSKTFADNNGKPEANVIWKGLAIDATVSVEWNEVYGVSYIRNYPAKGAIVEGSGDWIKCNVGEGVRLTDKDAIWKPYNDPQNSKTAINVYNENTLIHVVVGVQNQGTGDWEVVCQ